MDSEVLKEKLNEARTKVSDVVAQDEVRGQITLQGTAILQFAIPLILFLSSWHCFGVRLKVTGARSTGFILGQFITGFQSYSNKCGDDRDCIDLKDALAVSLKDLQSLMGQDADLNKEFDAARGRIQRFLVYCSLATLVGLVSVGIRLTLIIGRFKKRHRMLMWLSMTGCDFVCLMFILLEIQAAAGQKFASRVAEKGSSILGPLYPYAGSATFEVDLSRHFLEVMLAISMATTPVAWTCFRLYRLVMMPSKLGGAEEEETQTLINQQNDTKN